MQWKCAKKRKENTYHVCSIFENHILLFKWKLDNNQMSKITFLCKYSIIIIYGVFHWISYLKTTLFSQRFKESMKSIMERFHQKMNEMMFDIYYSINMTWKRKYIWTFLYRTQYNWTCLHMACVICWISRWRSGRMRSEKLQ